MAARVGVGKDAVARIWADHKLKPWKVDTLKISNDPRFEEKLIDVVGLYLNPPTRAVVFSYDEKTQVPGAGPHPAVVAAQTRPGGHDDPRLQAQRHHRPVRGDEHRHRRSPHRPAETSRRGRFTSVANLTAAITTWAEHRNTDPKPFIWKATAEDIIAKVERGRNTLHQIKSTTDH